MCYAIYLAAFLTALVGGLTLLRCVRGHSPNARLMTHALTQIEGPDPAGDEVPSHAPRSKNPGQPRRDTAPCTN